jgi:hypothetical protein
LLFPNSELPISISELSFLNRLCRPNNKNNLLLFLFYYNTTHIKTNNLDVSHILKKQELQYGNF